MASGAFCKLTSPGWLTYINSFTFFDNDDAVADGDAKNGDAKTGDDHADDMVMVIMITIIIT